MKHSGRSLTQDPCKWPHNASSLESAQHLDRSRSRKTTTLDKRNIRSLTHNASLRFIAQSLSSYPNPTTFRNGQNRVEVLRHHCELPSSAWPQAMPILESFLAPRISSKKPFQSCLRTPSFTPSFISAAIFLAAMATFSVKL